MLDSLTTVAAVRLLGGAEIVISRMDSLHPNSQHSHSEATFKAQPKPKSSAKAGRATNSAAHNQGDEESAVVSSIGDTSSSGSSPPVSPLYLTGLQVEFRPAKGEAFAFDKRNPATAPKGLAEPKANRTGIPHNALVSDVWAHEKQVGKPLQTGEPPPHTLDVQA